MKRCVASTPRNLCASGRRWTSHSSETLTDEALLEKVSARLNDGPYGANITVDTENKTISIPNGGELPLSPLFDPAWIKSRRRRQKAPAGPVSGQFRKHLLNNPFANALATPIRFCPVTKTHQPRYFFQEFDIVRHPETNEAWFAPNNDGFEHVQAHNEKQANRRGEAKTRTSVDKQSDAVSEGQDGEPSPKLSSYATSQSSIIEALGVNRKRIQGQLLGIRTGMAVNPKARTPVWRHDMTEVILQMMRREATEALILRTAAAVGSKFVQPCSTWEDIQAVQGRGCILWLPDKKDETAARQYATYDIQDAKYGGKIAVHNLYWLLGDEQVARLRAESEVFRGNDLLVLKMWRSKSMRQLHMLLWRLQGYLDVPDS